MAERATCTSSTTGTAVVTERKADERHPLTVPSHLVSLWSAVPSTRTAQPAALQRYAEMLRQPRILAQTPVLRGC